MITKSKEVKIAPEAHQKLRELFVVYQAAEQTLKTYIMGLKMGMGLEGEDWNIHTDLGVFIKGKVEVVNGHETQAEIPGKEG